MEIMEDKLKQNFIKLLNVANSRYPDGYIAQFFDMKTGQEKDLPDYELETFALFIANELAEAAQVDLLASTVNAIRLLRLAKQDLDEVIYARIEFRDSLKGIKNKP